MPVYIPAILQQENNQNYKLVRAQDVEGSVPTLTGSGSPAGLLTALQGTLYWDTLGLALWINIDAGTTWQPISGNSAGISSQTIIVESDDNVTLVEDQVSSETIITTS